MITGSEIRVLPYIGGHGQLEPIIRANLSQLADHPIDADPLNRSPLSSPAVEAAENSMRPQAAAAKLIVVVIILDDFKSKV